MSSGLYFGAGLAKGVNSALDRYLQRKFMREERKAAEERQQKERELENQTWMDRFKVQQEASEASSEKNWSRQQQALTEANRRQDVSRYGSAGVALPGSLPPGEAGPVSTDTGLMESIKGSPEFLLKKAESEAAQQAEIDAFRQMTPEVVRRNELLNPPRPDGGNQLKQAELMLEAIKQAMNMVTGMREAGDQGTALKAAMEAAGVNTEQGLVMYYADQIAETIGIPRSGIPPASGWASELNQLQQQIEDTTDPADAAAMLSRMSQLVPGGFTEENKKSLASDYKKKFGIELTWGDNGTPIAQAATGRLRNAQIESLQAKLTELQSKMEQIQAAIAEPSPVIRASKVAALGYRTDDDARAAMDNMIGESSAINAQLGVAEIRESARQAGEYIGRLGMEFGPISNPLKPIQNVAGGFLAGLGVNAPKKPGPEAAMAAAEPGFGQPRRKPAPEPMAATAPIAAAATARSTSQRAPMPQMPQLKVRGMATDNNVRTAPSSGRVTVGGNKIDRGLAEKERTYLGIAKWYFEQGTVPPPDIERELRHTQYLVKLAGGTPLEMKDVETISPQQGAAPGAIF